MKYLVCACALFALLINGCPLPEWGGDGQPCFDSQDPCNQGLVCRDIDNICIEPECTPSDPDCGPGKHCDFNMYECRPGEPTACEGDWDCPDGHYCDMDVNPHQCRPDEPECYDDNDCPAEHYCEDGVCKPEGIVPQGNIGDPCPADTGDGWIHQEAPACKAGLMCLWNSWGACYSGNPDECWLIPPPQNPVCHNNMCKGSFCAEPCSGDTCPYLFVPFQIETDVCYCVPVPPSENCDPLNNLDCGADRCLPLPYDTNYTYCVPVGSVPPGGVCNYNTNNFCGHGHICMPVEETVSNCIQICDPNNAGTCEGTCIALPGGAWGVCFVF